MSLYTLTEKLNKLLNLTVEYNDSTLHVGITVDEMKVLFNFL